MDATAILDVTAIMVAGVTAPIVFTASLITDGVGMAAVSATKAAMVATHALAAAVGMDMAAAMGVFVAMGVSVAMGALAVMGALAAMDGVAAMDTPAVGVERLSKRAPQRFKATCQRKPARHLRPVLHQRTTVFN